VSIGNILSYNGQAKLADLEYAKKMGDLTSHETRAVSEFTITLNQEIIDCVSTGHHAVHVD
jgi:hypothetical protein